MPKTTVLRELSNSTHRYVILARLRSQIILREEDDEVVLCHPAAIRAVLDILDDYVSAVGREQDREAIERKRSRRSVSPDPEEFFSRIRHRPLFTSTALSGDDGWLEDLPRVRWISRYGGSRFEAELARAAASYDADADMLTINADWRGYLELRAEVGRAVSDRTLVAIDEAWTIAHDEWAQALSSTVIACQNIATEDACADHLAEYLSDAALTASVANHRYMYLRCRSKISKLEWDRRKAAHPPGLEDLGGA